MLLFLFVCLFFLKKVSDRNFFDVIDATLLNSPSYFEKNKHLTKSNNKTTEKINVQQSDVRKESRKRFHESKEKKEKKGVTIEMKYLTIEMKYLTIGMKYLTIEMKYLTIGNLENLSSIRQWKNVANPIVDNIILENSYWKIISYIQSYIVLNIIYQCENGKQACLTAKKC